MFTSVVPDTRHTCPSLSSPSKDKVHAFHDPYASCIYFGCLEKEYTKLIPKGLFQHQISKGAFSMFEGPDCIKQFNDLLISLKDSLFQNIKKTDYPIDMTEKSWKEFKSATKCYLWSI